MIKHLVMALAILVSAVICTVACTNKAKKVDATAPIPMNEELSLKADRSQLDELRKEVPGEVKKDNDELAAILGMLNTGFEQEPNKIRDRFNKAIRDRRQKMDKQLRREREDYTRTEKKSREEYQKKQRAERDDFLRKKRSQEDRRDFFSDQDTKRREFQADQREKRNEFEATVLERRRTFEDYAREKTNFFNGEMRNYSKEYDERRRAKNLQSDMKRKAQRMKEEGREPISGTAAPSEPNAAEDELEQFKKIPQTPGVPLAPTDDK